MLHKYSIEFASPLRNHLQVNHYSTDDPVACVEFIEELLARGFRIKTIRHEGLDLPKPEFDKMIKSAAGRLASKSICATLGISAEEEHYRFGFTA